MVYKKKEVKKMAKLDLRVLAVLGIVILAALFMGGGLKSIFAQGFTIDSISLANPAVQGQPNEWIVSASLTGWGQNIIGNLGANDIQYSGATAQYPLSISGSISKNQGYYLIDNSNPKTVYKYRTVSKIGSVSGWCSLLYCPVNAAPACDGSPKYEITGKMPSGWLGAGTTDILRWCIYQDNVATVASISSLPNVIPEIDLTVSANGQSSPISLKYLGTYSLPNNLGSVSWTNSPVQSGSLGALSIGSQYIPYTPIGSDTWKVAYANDYAGGGVGQSWSDTATSLDAKYYTLQVSDIDLSSINCGGYGSDSAGLAKMAECARTYLQTLASTSNNLADKITSSNQNINGRMTSFAMDGGQKGFWVDLGNIYAAAPKLQFRIKSQWIGILFPSGEPQIVSASASPYPFKSGEPLTATIAVRNAGSGTGSFVAQDFSCGTLKPESQIYPVSIAAGQTGNIVFRLTSSYMTTETGTCSGKVVETGSQKSAAWSFSYKMDKPAQCVEGKTYWFGGNKIQVCQNGQLVDLKNCEFGVTSDSQGNWVCADSPSEFCKNNPTDPKCQPPEDWTKYLIWLILPALGGLLLYAAKKKAVWGIIGAVAGVLIAVVINWLMSNWLLALFGAALGGVLIYFFGGAVLFGIIALMTALKK